MVKRILLSTAMLLAFSATTWAQGSGCSSCDINNGGYVDDFAYSSEAVEGDGFALNNCSVGQGYFSNSDCECGENYKYTRLYAGYGDVDDVTQSGFTVDSDDGWGGGIGFGRRMGPIRLEKEFSYRHNSNDILAGDAILASGNLSTVASMFNLTYDFLKTEKSNVYVGAGLGAAYGDFHILTGDGAAIDDTAFAYQGIVGIDRALRNGMRGFVEYRYLAADFEFDATNDFEYEAQNVFFGFEFRR